VRYHTAAKTKEILMPITTKSQSTEPNKTITFDFGSDNVLRYVLGVAYWSFTYGSNDHHIKTVSLDLASNQPSASKIDCTVTGQLMDDSGNNIKNSSSSVTVCCIAELNSTDANISLAGAQGIPNGGNSGPIALPGSSLTISQAVLAGFNLSYSKDHHVRKLGTVAGFTANGSQGTITSQAWMADDSGNTASTATINGGLIAANPSEAGLLAESKTNQQTTDKLIVGFEKTLSSAVVILQSLHMEFSKDHHVKTLGGGCTGWSVDGKNVTLDNARAFMKDDSGHNQVDGSSSVSLAIFGIPA
jgi:hypothetical protein